MENTRYPGVEDFGADAAAATSRVADTVSEMTESASNSVRRIARGAADNVQRTADYFRENGMQKISQDVMDYAKANPTQALVGAAIVGFVVGRMMSSSRQ